MIDMLKIVTCTTFFMIMPPMPKVKVISSYPGSLHPLIESHLLHFSMSIHLSITTKECVIFPGYQLNTFLSYSSVLEVVLMLILPVFDLMHTKHDIHIQHVRQFPKGSVYPSKEFIIPSLPDLP